MTTVFEPCRFGTSISTCYHNPRCGYMQPGNWASPFGRCTEKVLPSDGSKEHPEIPRFGADDPWYET